MLHLVNKSPFERSALRSCLGHAREGDSILLYEDAIYAAKKDCANSDRMVTATQSLKVYVLGPDLAARGISSDQVIDGITVVDYGGFVDLVAETGPVQSWL